MERVSQQLLINMVQAQIGYRFKNPNLLLQAFTRRSYAQEHGGEDNEVLEFIGDKALDLAVIKLLVAKYGSMKSGEPVDGTKLGYWSRASLEQQGKIKSVPEDTFLCSLNEGELTKIKSRMVQKRTLARRMDEMGFSDQLFLGKGDANNGVAQATSVKEDLFEAILGAVTLDCGWDLTTICSVVDAMLVPEDFFANDMDDNYVRLIQDWEEQVNGVVPWFWFKEGSYLSLEYPPFVGVSQWFNLGEDTSWIKWECELKLLNDLPLYRGYGASKSEARRNVCKLAYEDLCKKGIIQEQTIRDEIENPNKEDAISQLEILARRGYFSIPTYDFKEAHDQNGNPVWTCVCKIAEIKKYYQKTSASKKEAKKAAAYQMLKHVLKG